MPKKEKKIPESQKGYIAAKQRYECANKPDISLEGLEAYDCLLWKTEGKYQGTFDESGYEIDHIKEQNSSNSSNNNEENLLALCSTCYNVKSKRLQQRLSSKKISNKKNK